MGSCSTRARPRSSNIRGAKPEATRSPTASPASGTCAFSDCTSLTSITIPNSVTSIGDEAFYDCTSLTSVTIPNSVTSIGDDAFSGCTSLTSVTIPNSVTSIGDWAFAGCTSLTSVTIPNSVTSIGDYAFYCCTSLTGVYFKGNAPSVGWYVFDGATNATVYYLPGTTGWGTTFGGRPTALWNPQVQTSDASFGVRTNQFGFTITGTPTSRRGGSLHESGQPRLDSAPNQHPHQRLVLFQRSPVDQSSRPFLPPPLAVTHLLARRRSGLGA